MMFSRPIDIHDIDEGVDRKQLTQLKQRFLALNAQRYSRTCAALSERQQQFLQLLPLLFHVNHPMLPGYVSHTTPAGVYQFSPTSEQLRYAKIIARSFHFQQDLSERYSQIDALFIMGSVGTIAQSDASDLDVWVCHNLPDSAAGLEELERKCQLISHWAEQQLHLEVHCFLMNADEFAQQRNRHLSSEASGTAQHYLLLDEFYRTALWLAGKVPLWWFVPATQEHNYAHFAEQLLTKRFVKAQDVVDFGGLPEIPANEFIGAGVWQLYKAIESPYKSVLKLVLLEVYASHQHHTQVADAEPAAELAANNTAEPLALALKRAIYASEPDADTLDPYVMVYQRLEDYLQEHQQPQRLDLVRRCFYFKVNKALSRTSSQRAKSWQRLLLEKMVAQWGWSKEQLLLLDNRAYWKAPHVLSERALLVNELNHSYRLLNELSRQQHNDIAISNHELMILGRKLHAAFERKAGKIELINPGIARDISEDALCFIRAEKAPDPSAPQEKNWQLIRGSQQDVALRYIDVSPIKHSRSLVELLLWAYANRIMENHSKIDIVGSDVAVNLSQKQQLMQALQHWLPLPLHVDHEQFMRPATVERLLLIVNTGVEPQADLHKKGMQMLSNQRDALGYSGLRENLVLNADFISLNSWGEIICRHYASDALSQCLLHYLRLFTPGKPQILPELSIRCFSTSHGHNIAQRLTELWRDIISCFYSGTRPRASRYLLEVSSEYYLIQFVQQIPQVLHFKSYEKLVERLGQAQSEYSPLVVDRYALRDKPLRIVAETMKTQGIYVFYYLEGNVAQLIIVDEQGSVFSHSSPYFNQQSLLRPLLSFIQSALQRQQLDHAQHHRNKDIFIYEITGNIKQQQGVAEARQLRQEWSPAHFIQIKAIADMDSEQQLRVSFFCDEQEFSAVDYGEQLYAAVAHYILGRRKSGERYPCYISDLDLSLCQERLAQQTGLQLGHYLQIKTELEQQLNAALAASTNNLK